MHRTTITTANIDLIARRIDRNRTAVLGDVRHFSPAPHLVSLRALGGPLYSAGIKRLPLSAAQGAMCQQEQPCSRLGTSGLWPLAWLSRPRASAN